MKTHPEDVLNPLLSAGLLLNTAGGIIVPGCARVLLHVEPRGFSVADDDGELLGEFQQDGLRDAVRILCEQAAPGRWEALLASGLVPTFEHSSPSTHDPAYASG